MAYHGVAALPVPPKFNDRMKATLAAASNLLFLLAVLGLWLVEKPIFGHRQLQGHALLIFIICGFALVIYYGFLIAAPNLKDLGAFWDMLTNAARAGVSQDDVDGMSSPHRTGRLGDIIAIVTNLWMPVTLNFMLIGWLIYASGGIANSPYSQVPIAMILIGQSVYDIPRIELNSDSKFPRPLVFVGQVASLYWSSLAVIVALLLALLLLQEYDPIVRQPAPAIEFAGIMAVSLLASMCINFITRRVDRGH